MTPDLRYELGGGREKKMGEDNKWDEKKKKTTTATRQDKQSLFVKHTLSRQAWMIVRVQQRAVVEKEEGKMVWKLGVVVEL